MDSINHPDHYTNRCSELTMFIVLSLDLDASLSQECIETAQKHSFCLGNAIKYLWRCGLKDDPKEDLKKARWYLSRMINRGEYRRWWQFWYGHRASLSALELAIESIDHLLNRI